MVGFHLVLLLQACLIFHEVKAKKPNFVIIIADDLGWDDVGFHGSPEAQTPNLDKMASEGVILMDYYVQPICTPTRSAMLTGKYPIHNGMQSSVIMTQQAWGLGLDEKLLPQYLQELGYKTHLVGKWHLGFFAKEYTPLKRGFDSFYGCYAGRGDYWSHESEAGEFQGLDLWDGEQPVRTQRGNYSTNMFSDVAVDVINNHDKSKPLFLMLSYQAVHSANTDEPLQAPEEEKAKFTNIRHEGRRIYMAMTSAMDNGIGKVKDALENAGMLDNTIVLFTTDNGGASDYFDSNQGSNFPFRGIKTTLFEGGVRAAGFVYSHLVQKPKHISRQLIHVTDWFPTVLSLAGGNPDDTKHDGYNVWDSVSKGVATSRKEILLNIDDYIYQNAALREGRWKYVSQQPGEWSGWFNSPDYEREAYWNVERRKKFSKTTVKCDHKAPEPPDCTDGCLFDIKNDPCEYIDLSTKKPRTFKRLKDKLERYKSAMVQPRYNDTTDPRSDPQVNDGLWKPWVDLSDPDSTKESSSVSQTAANAASDLEDVDKILQGSFQSVESDTLSGQAPSDTSQPQASQQGSSPWPAYRPSPAYQPPPAYQPSPAYQQPSANYQQLPAYHQSQPVSMPSYSTMSYSMPLVDDRDDAVETLEPSNDQSNADSLAATPTSQYDDTDQLQEPNSASGQTPDQMVRIQLQSHPVSQGPSPKDRDDVGSTSELWNELSTLDQIATEAPPKNSDDIDHLQGSKSGTYQYHLPQNRSQMFLS